jgi:hypothetical protein
VAGKWTTFVYRDQHTKRILIDERGKLFTVILVEPVGYIHGAE